MCSLFLGITAFVLYFIYDINSYMWQKQVLNTFFLLGTLLLGIATGLDLWFAWTTGAFSGAADILLLIAACFCFAALIYSLFFALPFQETYTQNSSGRKVYQSGVYALCRHPGILCFWTTYLLLGLAALPSGMIVRSLVFSFLNLLYAWFQDCVTFPKTFCDYSDYQKCVPFLIPTLHSISMARKTLFSTQDEEAIL